MPEIIMVTGGRDFDNRALAEHTLDAFVEPGDILLTGGAQGADQIAMNHWHYTLQLPYITMPAAWDRQGRAAGAVRNLAMLQGQAVEPFGDTTPSVVIAFPGGKGTAHAVKEAEKRGILVVRVRA